MRKLGAFFFLVMAASVPVTIGNLWAQGAKSTAPASDPVRANAHVRALDPAITAQHTRIQSLLPSETNSKISREVPAFREQTSRLKSGADLRALATAQVRRDFPNLTARQTDVLAFTLLNETYASLPSDSAGDISSEQQLRLQQLMQQRSQLEAALSNMMKSMSDTSDSIIQNIK